MFGRTAEEQAASVGEQALGNAVYHRDWYVPRPHEEPSLRAPPPARYRHAHGPRAQPDRSTLPQGLGSAGGNHGLSEPALEGVEVVARIDPRFVLGGEDEPTLGEHAAQGAAPHLALPLALPH